MKYIYRRRLWVMILVNIGIITGLLSTDSRTEDLFKGIKVGISAGIHQAHSKIEADTNIQGSLKDRVTLSGHTPFYGMQFEVIRPLMAGLHGGFSLGYGHGTNSIKSRITSTIPDVLFEQYLRQKLEAALILGSPFGAMFPYLKIGAVWGQFQMKTSNGTGDSNVKMFRPGFLLGAGLDFAANAKWLFGGTIQYERYKKMKGTYIPGNGGAAFSGWTMKPSLISAAVSIKRKLG